MKRQQVIERLKAGNARFVEDKLDGKLKDKDRRLSLVNGQKPYAVILSCADSRVIPEVAFDTGLGELFVIRVAGNVANTSTIASIEYAVSSLKTEVIIVLGHQSCGAITAAMKGGDYGYNLNHLLAHITPAINEAGDGASVDKVVKLNADKTVRALLKRSEIINDAFSTGNLDVIPAFYNLDSGKIDIVL